MTRNEKLTNVVEKYADLVYKIAFSKTNHKENAEDIFQEVFIRYSQKAPKFKSEEHEKAWIIRVTINLSINLHNTSWNKTTTSLDENMNLEEDEKIIIDEIRKLPSNYQNVIYLYYYEGYKVSEISKILKKREGTIKTWLSRARETLKKELKGGWDNE